MHRTSKIVLLVGSALTVTSLAAGNAQATILYSNIDPNNYPGYLDALNTADFISNYGSGTARIEAMSFTPSVTAEFTSAVLGIRIANPASFRADVTLYSDDNGLPGTAIETIDVENLQQRPAIAPVTVLSVTNPTLVAGTQYWLAVSPNPADSDTSLDWFQNSLGDDQPIAASFSNLDDPSWFITDNSVDRPAFTVLGAVPEPASLSLMMMAVPLLARRRRM